FSRDWSSDVCSSDLGRPAHPLGHAAQRRWQNLAGRPRLRPGKRQDLPGPHHPGRRQRTQAPRLRRHPHVRPHLHLDPRRINPLRHGLFVGAPPRCEPGGHAFAPGAGAPTIRGGSGLSVGAPPDRRTARCEPAHHTFAPAANATSTATPTAPSTPPNSNTPPPNSPPTNPTTP